MHELIVLSNTVQNAIIGNDNSVSGGIIGAFSLLAVNWLLMRLLYKAPKITAAIEGSSTTLIKDGKIDKKAMDRESLTHEELISVLNRNSFNNPEQIELCVLEPNGTFYVKGKSPNEEETHSVTLLKAIEKLSREVAELRGELRKANSE